MAVVVHEYMHGISARLTGGRMNIDCLNGDESYGLGEGWGDIFGVIFQTNENTTREAVFTLGEYTNVAGMRIYSYSTNMSINPSTYGFVIEEGYEGGHAKGEVWAVILYEVYWILVEKHGFDPDWYNTRPNSHSLGGNIIFAQLLIDGMKIQPCTPTFPQARDAILEADRINNNAENLNELWRGFAKRTRR